MVYVLSFLVTILFTFNAYSYEASARPSTRHNPPIYNELRDARVPHSKLNIDFDQVYAKVNPERGTVVVSAALFTKNSKTDNLSFGGRITPTATTYLRPLPNSRFANFRPFAQVRCLDYTCQQLAVNIGIRTSISNSAYSGEQTFVLYPDDIDRLITYVQPR